MDYSILLVGASGRMGQEIVAAVERQASPAPRIIAGLVAPGDPLSGTFVPGIEAALAADPLPQFAQCDVIIDFSSPRGALKAVELARSYSKPLLSCSTGLTEAQERAIIEAGSEIPVLRTRNTSIGVTILEQLVEEAARRCGSSFDLELVELHHRHKADAPSGTAIQLLEAACRGRGSDLQTHLNVGRRGAEAKRTEGEIGAQAVRGGDVAGEHTVYFFGEGERIELTHRSSNRRIFADGALRAASWLVENTRRGTRAGNFTMRDVL